MANSNEHIEQFLNYYLEKETSPDYAVLISGCWGSGKTYFIKQFLAGKDPDGQNKDVVKIKEWLTDCEKYTVVYVSLFGARSRAEMDQRVLEKLHPILNSELLKTIPGAVSLIGKILGVISSNPAGVVVGAAAGDAGTFAANKIIEAFKQKSKKFEKIVIVFDDVERADMPLPELLGYLNAYVEHLHVPCILLADKEKWEEAQKCQEDKSTLHKLSSTKEKVVGKEFQIQTSVDDIVNAWLAPEKGVLDVSTDVKNLWWKNKECIYELFSCLETAKIKYSGKEEWGVNEKKQHRYDREQMCEYVSKIPLRNFRALKHTIKDFDNLCSYYCPELGVLLKSEISQERGAAGIFIRHFLKMRYCLTIGMYELSCMWNRSVIYYVRDDVAEENSLTKWDCFEDVMYKADSFDGFPMMDWLINSCFDKDSVLKKIKSSAFFGGYEKFMIRQVYHWWGLNDKEATESFKMMNDALDAGKIKDPNTLVYLFVVMCILAKEDFATFNIEFVKKRFDEYLDAHSDKISGEEVDNLESIRMSYGSVDMYKDELIPFRNRLISILAQENEKLKQKKEEDFFENLQSEDGEIYGKAYSLINLISTKKKFSFVQVDVPTFVNIFRKLNRSRRDEIFTALDYRYLNIPDDCDLEAERNFLNALKSECQKLIQEKREVPLPSLFSVNHLIESINACLQKIEQKTKKENDDVA